MARVLILGAGPTGLGVAHRLEELGEHDWTIVEAEPGPGGLAASVVDGRGFTWDLGGHVQFSHYETFDDYMDRALGADGWLRHQRESWIWIRGRFVPYPFQYNLHRLPAEERWECVRGLLHVARSPSPRVDTFADWVLATFGAGVARVFLRPYNLKVWAHPLETLSAHWVGDRVAVPPLEKVLEGVCLGRDQVSWGPNSTFRFPRRGGTGAIWAALAALLPADRQRYSTRVTAVDARARRVSCESGESLGYEHLVSTIPLDTLVVLLRAGGLSEWAPHLLYSTTHVVGVGMEGTPPEHLRTKCWMYFPEADCPFYRVTVFSNYSPENTPRPGRTWSLMAEVSESRHKPVARRSLADDVLAGFRATGLIRDREVVLSVWSRSLPRGYPVPSLDRDRALRALLPALEREQIYSRGRFGAWKYEVSNQDHSFMQGWECATRLLTGEAGCEVTLNCPEDVNRR